MAVVTIDKVNESLRQSLSFLHLEEKMSWDDIEYHLADMVETLKTGEGLEFIPPAKSRAESSVEKKARLWSEKNAVLAALFSCKEFKEFADDNVSIKIWSRDTDERIYFENDSPDQKWRCCYYLTGNDYYPPDTIDRDYGLSDALFEALKPFMASVRSHHATGTKLYGSTIPKHTADVARKKLHKAALDRGLKKYRADLKKSQN